MVETSDNSRQLRKIAKLKDGRLQTVSSGQKWANVSRIKLLRTAGLIDLRWRKTKTVETAVVALDREAVAVEPLLCSKSLDSSVGFALSGPSHQPLCQPPSTATWSMDIRLLPAGLSLLNFLFPIYLSQPPNLQFWCNFLDVLA
ncbi:unnamed protein product [Citrullus colocynthis]|uniref:Uncharacterized protein n=1 Tax=Citrullus colocynthis TaxID=252529 RepID=A0ABP0Y0S3_9ROSI